jgi:hypothetical protein
MKVVRPQGSAVVAALKRYDKNLDVRWSWQKRMWAVVTRPLRPDLIPAPMKWVQTATGWMEGRLPEKSEAAVSFRTKTMPVGYVKHLSWDLVRQIIETDTWRNGRIAKQLAKMQEAAERDRMRVSRDRWREARKYMNWHARTHPMAV